MKSIKLLIILLALISLPAIINCSANRANSTANRSAQDSAVSEFYDRNCAGCHGFDGVPSRDEMPNFSDPKFHQEHTDAQLQTSILQGKPPRMPGYQNRIEQEKINLPELISYLRGLSKKEGQKK